MASSQGSSRVRSFSGSRMELVYRNGRLQSMMYMHGWQTRRELLNLILPDTACGKDRRQDFGFADAERWVR